MVYIPFLTHFLFWPVNSFVGYLIWAVIILALLVVGKRDISMFGITLRNVGLDFKVTAIWVIPLCIVNSLSNIDVSSIFNSSGIECALLLVVIELSIIFVASKLFTGQTSVKDNITKGKLIILPVVAISSFIVIPAIFYRASRRLHRQP